MHKILNHSNAGTIPTEAIDEVARYLEALVEVSFRLVCERVSIQEFQDVCIGTEYLLPLVRCDKVVHVLITSVYCHQGIRRFFSTWRTSLIGPHLSTLEAISRNVELRSLVKNILIENDCDRNDPWNTTEHLQSDNTWSRDDIWTVLSTQIGIVAFGTRLEDKWLCLESIRIRDYRIDSTKLELCPETTRTRDYRIGTSTPSVPDPEQ